MSNSADKRENKETEEFLEKNKKGTNSSEYKGSSNDFLNGLNVFKFLNENKNSHNKEFVLHKKLNSRDDLQVSDDVIERIIATSRAKESSPSAPARESNESEDDKNNVDEEQNKKGSFQQIKKYNDDEDVRRAAAIALAISNSHLSPQQAQQLVGQDERQKQFLEEAKKKKKQLPGWMLNVNNLQNIIAQTNSALANGQQWTWPGQQHDQNSSHMQKDPRDKISNVNLSEQNSIQSDARNTRNRQNLGNDKSQDHVQKNVEDELSPMLEMDLKTNIKILDDSKKSEDSALAVKAKQKVNEGLKIRSQVSSALPTSLKQNHSTGSSDPSHTGKNKRINPSYLSWANNVLSPSLVESLSKSSKSKEKIHSIESISLNSVVWKRRSGLGKLSTKHAWERRKLALQGSKLIYYALFENEKNEGDQCNVSLNKLRNQQLEDMPQRSVDNKKLNIWEQAAVNLQTATETWNKNLKHLNIVVPLNQSDPNDPRGMMDIVKEHASIYATNSHGGAPTPFVLSVKNGIELKWKFCFDSHEDQMKWLHALTDVIVKASLQEFQPESDISQDDSKNWKMLSIKSESFKDFNSSIEPKKDDSMSFSQERTFFGLSMESILNDSNFYSIIGFLNLLLIIVNTLENFQFWLVIGLVNAFMWIKLHYNHRNVNEDKEVLDEVENDENTEGLFDGKQQEIIITKPKAGSTTIMIKEPKDSKLNNKGERFPGWRKVSGSSLQVRSEGYVLSKMKRASPGELYECVAVDICSSSKRLRQFSQRVDMSSLCDENETMMKRNTEVSCPNFFVVAIAFPTEPPKLTKAETDGQGINVVIYMKMKKETRRILEEIFGSDPNLDSLNENQKEQVKGIRLFNEWCRRSPDDPKFQARFKLVPNMVNLEEIGIPSYISKYNSKPVLIKRAGVTGFLSSHKDPDVMEFEISLHPFPYIAKQGFSYLHQSFFSKLITSIGFVVEGRDDSELPEVVLGATQLCYVDPSDVVDATKLFSGQAQSAFN